jgi:galactonate dehydratase
MEALRKAAGDSADFVLTANGRLTPGDAATLASVFEREHLLWFDEPCATSSLGPVRKLSEENVTPLGFGADAPQASYFQNLLREDAIDVCRPELALHGISGIRKIAALAETYYVAVAPRHGEGPINTAAALHLAASLPNFFIQHIPSPASAEDRAMRDAIAGPQVESVTGGFAALPSQPGLGITVNRQAIERYGSSIQ